LEKAIELIPAAFNVVSLEGALKMSKVLLDAFGQEEVGGLEGDGAELREDASLSVDLVLEKVETELLGPNSRSKEFDSTAKEIE
jgi:hypothetical protein